MIGDGGRVCKQTWLESSSRYKALFGIAERGFDPQQTQDAIDNDFSACRKVSMNAKNSYAQLMVPSVFCWQNWTWRRKLIRGLDIVRGPISHTPDGHHS